MNQRTSRARISITQRGRTVVVRAVLSIIVALGALTALPGGQAGASDDPQTIWGSSTPTRAVTTQQTVLVGTRLRVAADGQISAVRFYKPDDAKHWYTAYLLNSSGSQLAKVAVSVADRAGWVQLTFRRPVTVEAGQTYVAAVKVRPGGSYGLEADALGDGRVQVSGPLTALAGVSGPLDSISSGPTDSAVSGTNFFVDVSYATTPTSTPTTTTTRPTSTPTTTTRPTSTPTTTRPTSTPTTTRPTSTPSVPGPAGFPNASNTGVPAGIRLTPSGSITVTRDGTVIDGLHVRGSITIEADNVVIRNTKVEVATSTSPILVVSGSTGALIDHVEVNGLNGSGQGINFKQGASGGTIRYSNIYGGEDGIRISAHNTTVEHTYVHHLQRRAGGHHDTIQIRAGDNIVIRHNNLQAYVPETRDPMNAAIQFGTLIGTDRISNLRVTDNLMNGGNVTVNGGGRGEVDSAVYSRNRFGRDHRYGVHGNLQNSVWEASNVYHDNGQPAR